MPIYLYRFNFEVADSGAARRAPIHHVGIAIDEALLIKADEGGADGLRESLIKRKPLPFPIAGASDASELREDSAAGCRLPLPHAFNELLAAKCRFAGAFLGELSLNDELRDNAGVVCPRHP